MNMCPQDSNRERTSRFKVMHIVGCFPERGTIGVNAKNQFSSSSEIVWQGLCNKPSSETRRSCMHMPWRQRSEEQVTRKEGRDTNYEKKKKRTRKKGGMRSQMSPGPVHICTFWIINPHGTCPDRPRLENPPCVGWHVCPEVSELEHHQKESGQYINVKGIGQPETLTRHGATIIEMV